MRLITCGQFFLPVRQVGAVISALNPPPPSSMAISISESNDQACRLRYGDANLEIFAPRIEPFPVQFLSLQSIARLTTGVHSTKPRLAI
jgi:hypothetical protein